MISRASLGHAYANIQDVVPLFARELKCNFSVFLDANDDGLRAELEWASRRKGSKLKFWNSLHI